MQCYSFNHGSTMKVYWWNKKSNFGDELTPYLLERFGIPVKWANPERAEMVVIGSILEHLPRTWDGMIVGAGKLFDRPISLPNAKILVVRGELTAQDFLSKASKGDPGLLAPFLVPKQKKKYRVGILPHWSDEELVPRFSFLDGHIISPTQHPIKVLQEISSCRRLITSSLHGAIVADSYGIPRRSEIFKNAIREGNDFKFRDYSSVLQIPHEFGKMVKAPKRQVKKIQKELLEVFRTL